MLKQSLMGIIVFFNKGHLKEHFDNNLKNNCITESINLLPNTKKDHFQKLNINDLKNNLENNQAFF